jgi:HlyD family secretion protein
MFLVLSRSLADLIEGSGPRRISLQTWNNSVRKPIPLNNLSTKKIALIFTPILIVLLALLWLWWGNNNQRNPFRLAPVVRGDLEAVISATGTVEPEEVIDVGAQVAGKIVAFGKDKHGKTVDYGSDIEAGTVLARIDDSIYVSEVSQVKAQLGQSKANVQRAQADLGQFKAKLFQAEADWQRAQQLGPSEALSQSDFDAARAAYEVARANLNVGQAALRQVKEAVSQSEAALQKAKQNLDYCTVKSPVKGVIIDRRVNIGQTVVASLSAPSLFLIARDLKKMQVWASVNEADIGNIHPGQVVTFTVDALPGKTFQGEVVKIRLNATMTQNVVTYTVEVNTDNSAGLLIPYLTANLKFIVQERKNILMVPNAALRWLPQPEQIDPDFRQTAGKKEPKGPDAPSSTPAASKVDKGESGLGTLWVPQGRYVQPLKVRLGPTDGSMTEVQGQNLNEGVQVVLGEQPKETEAGPAGSPFAPQLFKGQKR